MYNTYFIVQYLTTGVTIYITYYKKKIKNERKKKGKGKKNGNF